MNGLVFFFPVPPTVVVFPANITAVEGSTVVLPCTAEGYPTPHVAWIAPNGTVLQNRTRDTNLTLTSVSRYSSGTYQCKATNELGPNSATVKLDVLCKFFSFWVLDVRVFCWGYYWHVWCFPCFSVSAAMQVDTMSWLVWLNECIWVLLTYR